MLSAFVFLLLDTYNPSFTYLIHIPFELNEFIIFCILVSMYCKNISAIILGNGDLMNLNEYTYLTISKVTKVNF